MKMRQNVTWMGGLRCTWHNAYVKF